ncbi:hypothetical protein CONPUDRAFT_60015 [Coniophora puteana RWD-64-598 SS2]|uniref:Uncharacterized protein n=1 Tax=Coniophora puteana (strain RWD-64-598) TaxID=741705 RepID=A0A5M3MJP9_CONPW|nr:uncharacterized protein CONPUDRAFT_60015 [Coniophora puteana RWD-64-598 SS2]EIW79276.1 hypothetical protein CONPUDRAFT_60015 [Coniophora puteana RWD-64-598 SS2]
MLDILCFSWDFRTIEGREKMAAFLLELLDGGHRFDIVGLGDLEIDAGSTLGRPSSFPIPGTEVAGIQAAFRFTLREPHACSRGFFRLVPGPEGYKAFTVYTAMHELVGHEEPTTRPRGIPWDPTTMTTWEEDREKEVEAIELGGGQCGLMAAARFCHMGIHALVIEKTPRVGDPANFLEYIGRRKLADFMESYAIQQELTIWTSSSFVLSRTGYHLASSNVEALMGPEVAAKVGPVWGPDAVGEL